MNEYAEIIGYKENESGTRLSVVIPEKALWEYLKRFAVNGKVKAEIRLDDGRTITAEQRKKAYATIRDMATYTGYMPEEMKELMKYSYIADTGADYFSLSNCSVTEARLYINYLIEFCFQWGIPLLESGLNRTDDIDTYLYMCIRHKKCCITGLPGDLHHCTGSRIGMGNNRNKVSHSGREFICLSRTYHNEIHAIGEKDFFEKYKIYGLKIDDETLIELGYKTDEEP